MASIKNHFIPFEPILKWGLMFYIDRVRQHDQKAFSQTDTEDLFTGNFMMCAHTHMVF